MSLVRFAQSLAKTFVLVCTQPGEPFPFERYEAIKAAAPGAYVYHIHRTIEQNPEAPGFWDMWREIFKAHSFVEGDYIVASEEYGQKLAKELGGVYMPYDLNRSVFPIKATPVRRAPLLNWQDMVPEFRKNLIQRVTIFGAESCGKTTLTRDLATSLRSRWLFEWARPYLEAVGSEITEKKMTAIWKGQLALQQSAGYDTDQPIILQDTDLFSTLGYWKFWTPETVPKDLESDAINNQSDLYIVVKSNIPFEPDPLRYGGDEREADDKYWIDLCQEYNLNYVVLDHADRKARVMESGVHIGKLLFEQIVNPLTYERVFND